LFFPHFITADASRFCSRSVLMAATSIWRSFQHYLLAVNLVVLPKAVDGSDPPENVAISKRQVAIMLHCAGEEAYEIFSQFEFADGKSADNLEDVLAKFETHCNPRKNILYETFLFWSLSQFDGEPIDLLVKRLKTQAAKCEFGQMQERMLLCRVIFGLSDIKLKERLLRNGKITLTNAMVDIRAAEIIRQQLSKMAEGDQSMTGVAAVGAEKHIPSRVQIKNCKFCTFSHLKGKCPAYGKKCRSCGSLNHFEKACNEAKHKSIKNIDTNREKQMESLFIGMMSSQKSCSKS